MDLERLTDLVTRFTGVSVQYPATKLSGAVRLLVQGPVDRVGAWRIYNQALGSLGFTTVLSDSGVYQVVQMAEAANVATAISAEDLAAMRFPPGFIALIIPLRNLSAEAAVKALGTLAGGTTSTVKSLGGADDRVLVAGARERVDDVRRSLTAMDVPGIVPAVRMFRPARTAPATLQAAVAGMWAAVGRIGDRKIPAEILIAPDGVQLALLTATSAIDRLFDLASSLDQAEPTERRTYRPRFFSIEDVAGLLKQVLKSDQVGTVDIIPDKLTNSLLITATAAQHERITQLVRTMDEAPATSRRQLRSFPIRYRAADDIAKILVALIEAGAGTGEDPAATRADTPAEPAKVAAGAAPVGVHLPAGEQPPVITPVETNVRTARSATITTDVVTNRLIVIGDPRAIDQVNSLLKELDTPQPQVQLEVVLVTVSGSQNLTLGTEIAGAISAGSLSGTVASLFGLSDPVAGDRVRRTPKPSNGFTGVVLNPGDFAVVVKALETVNNGRSVIRSQVVTNNNTKATVNGVVQQPLTSTNSNSTAATTGVSGTTDAGTQITITPSISPADHVTLTYAISQSAFLGEAITTSDGTVIPPAKRADSLTAVTTIPDGFTIAVGGLSNRSTTAADSHVPFLGTIPLLGYLFKNTSESQTDSRFYVFIRSEVLRNRHFDDLRARSTQTRGTAGLDDGTPILLPRLTP